MQKLVLLFSMLSLVGMAADESFEFVGIDRTAKDTYTGWPKGASSDWPRWTIRTDGCNQLAADSIGEIYWDKSTDTGVIVWLDWSLDQKTHEVKYWSVGQCKVVEIRSAR